MTSTTTPGFTTFDQAEWRDRQEEAKRAVETYLDGAEADQDAVAEAVRRLTPLMERVHAVRVDDDEDAAAVALEAGMPILDEVLG